MKRKPAWQQQLDALISPTAAQEREFYSRRMAWWRNAVDARIARLARADSPIEERMASEALDEARVEVSRIETQLAVLA